MPAISSLTADPSLFPHLEDVDSPTLPAGRPHARARGRDADWRQQMARAYAYAAGRARSDEELRQLDSEYEAELAQGADFTRYRRGSEFMEAPKISIDRNAAARIKFMIACIQRG